MKIQSIGDELLYEDRDKDVKKERFALHNSAKAPQMKCTRFLVKILNVRGQH